MSHSITRRHFLQTATALGAGVAAPALINAAEAKWGDLVGRFVYDGKPPQRKKLKVDKDLEYTAGLDIRDESLMVGPDGGLGNVYVYLRTAKVPISPELEATAAPEVVLDNRDWIFQPHCLKIWYTKQAFSLVNSDPVPQNVAFTPLGDVPANIVLPVGGKAAYKFARKQSIPIAIACNYHPWERAYVLPRDNPYVAVSAADGTFCLPKLPVGEWEFQAWHERAEHFNDPRWAKGRFQFTIKAGANDLGAIKIAAKMLEEPS